ncbi:response regulator transcription factor [Streptomyces sp. NPDC088194]|uniref:response regulator transcription factor n=1 Tax=Streptomyces sp. NPDC088194 TaxID=3154931 RepID=UPI00344E4D7D
MTRQATDDSTSHAGDPARSAAEEELSPRQTEVLRLVGGGLSNRHISRELNISEKTVKNHLTAIFLKTGLGDRTQAAIYALRSIPADEEIGRGAKRGNGSSTAAAGPCLTPRQTEVLHLVGGGMSNRHISRELNISEKTVKNHLTAIFLKTGLGDRTQAAIYALRSMPRRRPTAPGRAGQDELVPL